MLRDETRHEPLAKASVAPADANAVLQQELPHRECRETCGPAAWGGDTPDDMVETKNLPGHMVEQTADETDSRTAHLPVADAPQSSSRCYHFWGIAAGCNEAAKR